VGHHVVPVPVFFVLLALGACHHPDVAPPSKAGVAIDATTTAPQPSASVPETCDAKTARATPSSSGQAMVAGGDGQPHALHWIRFDAKTQPARGTLFYLAGGPLSHMNYANLATSFQRVAFPDLDLVLHDYFGFNCSTPIQDAATLGARHASLTMPAMAHDFIQLKRTLLGVNPRAFVMGGSHGAMLGAQIVRDYPAEIERAVLFSGDTESGWLDDGWFRFDRLMTKLDATHPGFALRLAKLLESAEEGKLIVPKGGEGVALDRPTLEVGLWMAFSLDSGAQAALPTLVEMAEKGERKWLANVRDAALALLEPVPVAAPPTDVSLVTTFHRCNVWFPKSTRANAPTGETRFFRHESFVRYWNALCKDYDSLGEYPLRATAGAPTSVPVLTWIGDQDTFDPRATRAHWSALTSNLSFQVIDGWSHDFGPSPTEGFMRAAALVKDFIGQAPRVGP
jgi:pimeloyl-ACP methyl ester carboxylesterase